MLGAIAVPWLAFANGANDNFKGVATLHGGGVLPYRKALLWATATTLAGSLTAIVLAQGLVERFRGRGLVPEAIVATPVFLMAVACGAAGTVLLATRLALPISTTHALLGGLMGSGIVLAGPAAVNVSALGRGFVLPLLLSPALAMVLAAAVYPLMRWARRRLGVTAETCVCVGGVVQPATLLPGAGAVRLASGLTITVDRLESCRRTYGGIVFGVAAQTALDRLHLLTGGAVGFARGLNDAPKIAALLVGSSALGPTGALLVVASAMAAGSLAARRVARTMASGITTMDGGQAFAANVVTAALVTLASPLALPVSTTHVSCGALFGIGLSSGGARTRTILQILAAWLVTLPLGAALAAAVALLLK